MKHFQVGDFVRVAGLANSQWRDITGSIVEVVERPVDETNEIVQECAVRFKGYYLWFLADHLVKTVSEKCVRFFRAEVLHRWKLDPGEVAHLNGDREGLVALLQDRYDFSTKRAQAEVDEFLVMIHDRLVRATELTPPRPSASVAGDCPQAA